MRFAYLKDPLFLFCVAAYFINRLAVKPFCDHPFVHGYLNDLICLPFWIPIMLFGMRVTGLRRHDDRPRGAEIIIPLLVWSIIFEAYIPYTQMFAAYATADHVDILCYATGALVSTYFWDYWYTNNLHAQPHVTSPNP